MKLGILGTGKIVQEFLPWIVEHTPFTVQAVCSTPRSAAAAGELCAQYQIPQRTTNYFELLQPTSASGSRRERRPRSWRRWHSASSCSCSRP